MASYPRSRSQSMGLVDGGYRTMSFRRGGQGVIDTTSGFSKVSRRKSCTDYVNTLPYPDTGFRASTCIGFPLLVEGSYRTLSFEYAYHKFCPVPFEDSGGASHVSSADPSLGLLETLVWAKANPAGNPEFDSLNFLFELRDFPSMLKNLGDLYRKGDLSSLAGLPISVQFGWKPLLSDLRSLLGVAEAVKARLDKLRDTRDVKTQYAYLGNWDATTHQTYRFGNVSFLRSRSTSTKSWAVYKASLMTDRVPNWDWNDAANLAYSSSLSAATIWNSFPWTWLVDYLSNVGTLLEAVRGNIPYRVEMANIMVNLKTKVTYEGINPIGGDLEFRSGSYDVETKIRHISINPLPTIALKPGITGAQLSNLSALILAKTLGSDIRVGR